MTNVASLVADLTRPWRHGEHADCRDIVLNEPLVLDGLDIRGIDLSGAALNGGLSARGTCFQGLAWLRNTQIKGMCDLDGATFKSDLRADGVCADTITLDHCTYQGVLSLARAKAKSVSLRQALVMANLTLESAAIDGLVDLSETEILGGLWTEQARIHDLRTDSAEISGRIQLPKPLWSS